MPQWSFEYILNSILQFIKKIKTKNFKKHITIIIINVFVCAHVHVCTQLRSTTVCFQRSEGDS